MRPSLNQSVVSCRLPVIANQIKMPSPHSDIYEAIYEIVRQVPPGRITTYGHVAAAIGLKSGARMVGYAMNSTQSVSPAGPAHRVVNRNGMLSGKAHFGPGDEMAKLLRAEGVKVKDDMVQDFEALLWDPAIELTL